MKAPRHLIALLALASVLLPAPGAFAGEGHDHGGEAPAAAGTASPRLQAHSDLFELVGIVDRGQMTVYLDRYGTNEPVADARIEFESGANKGTAARQADGTYLIKFDALAKPGELPFAFTVSAGPVTDLLAGELDLKDPHDHGDEGPRRWKLWAGYALAAAAVLAIATFLTRANRSARRNRLKG
jgi:cobalt-zinc-cadmium efflux system membrane fusion protein